MAILQSYAFMDIASITNFKLWAQTISNAFAAFGWVQSADTGQVNWSTISTVPANTTTIFEIWQMGDALQATNPVFLKVYYGSQSSGPMISIQAGSGSTGAGVLTNTTGQTLLGTAATPNPDVLWECDLSGSTNRMQFCMWRGSTSAVFLSIERSHDVDGNDTASYYTLLLGGNEQPNGLQQTIMPPATGGVLTAEIDGLTFQTNDSTAAFATSTAAVPFFPMVGKVDNPLMGGLCVKKGDFADGSQFTASIYGGNHNYMCIASCPSQWGKNGTQASNTVAMRFE